MTNPPDKPKYGVCAEHKWKGEGYCPTCQGETAASDSKTVTDAEIARFRDKFRIDPTDADPEDFLALLTPAKLRDEAIAARKAVRTLLRAVEQWQDQYDSLRDDTGNKCDECGNYTLTAHSATGETEINGVPVEMDADWETCRFCALQAELDAANALCEKLKQEAEIHAQEARTHKSTVHKIYQLVTGATGEPGNWNGAKPVKQLIDRIAELTAAIEAALILSGRLEGNGIGIESKIVEENAKQIGQILADALKGREDML